VNSFSLNQDTPGGHVSSWASRLGAPDGHIKATVTVDDLRPADQWLPFVAFDWCESDSCARQARFGIFFRPAGAASIVLIKNGEAVAKSASPVGLKAGVAFHMACEWRGNGFLQCQIDEGALLRFALPFVPQQMSIMSGSADVSIEDIQIR
jgi:hypothetical protein